MTISPEMLAKQYLSSKEVSTASNNALFFKDALVVIFDGLIIFRGDLNMAAAIPSLEALSCGFGLPVAVIEKEAAKAYNSKKFRVGKHTGPGNWLKSSWSTEEGFDFGFKEKYNKYGYKVKEKAEEKKEEASTKATTTSGSFSTRTKPIDRSHLSSVNHTTAHHRATSHHERVWEDEDEEYNDTILDGIHWQ